MRKMIAGGSLVATFLAALAVSMPVLGVLMMFGSDAGGAVCDEEDQGGFGQPATGAQLASTAQSASADGRVGTEFETLNAEQLRNAKTIIDVGQQAEVLEFGLVVAIATAMQESKLINLDYGDRDSLGLFQQRPSTGWGTPEQVTDPVFAARAFFGGPGGPHWQAPSNRSEPPGLRDIVGYESMTVAEAAQAVQRSAFPDAYAQWEPMARVTVSALAGDGGDNVICGPGDAMACPATDFAAEEGLTPDALRVLRCVHQEFPEVPGYAGVGDRPSNDASDHPAGRAVDALMPPGGTVYSPRAVGDRVSDWLVQHAPELGVRYVIWWEKIWSIERAEEGWRPYEHPSGADDDTSAHRDHVHVSVYGDSAGTEVGEWVVPVQGTYVITARFGSCGSAWTACHTGTDLASPAVRPIVAAASGTVTTIADLGSESYGRYVTLTHSDGTETWYAHLDEFAPSLAVDDTVHAGQLIGYMGNTGNTVGPTGRHLHFEVRPNGGPPVNPEPWMLRRGVRL